jgi:hypothetical protein
MSATMRKGLAVPFCKAFSRTKGMGEIFHGQTKGYMFACDQLHVINISIIFLVFKSLLDFSQICQIPNAS